MSSYSASFMVAAPKTGNEICIPSGSSGIFGIIQAVDSLIDESPPITLRLGVFTAYCMLHDSLADGPLLEATVSPNAICFNSAIDACARAGSEYLLD